MQFKASGEVSLYMQHHKALPISGRLLTFRTSYLNPQRMTLGGGGGGGGGDSVLICF